MHVSPLPALYLLGVFVEAVGIFIFTKDVISSNTRLLKELQDVRSSLRPIELRAERIEAFDDLTGLVFSGTRASGPRPSPAELSGARRQRWMLWLGAVLLMAGIIMQMPQNLASTLSP